MNVSAQKARYSERGAAGRVRARRIKGSQRSIFALVAQVGGGEGAGGFAMHSGECGVLC